MCIYLFIYNKGSRVKEGNSEWKVSSPWHLQASGQTNSLLSLSPGGRHPLHTWVVLTFTELSAHITVLES